MADFLLKASTAPLARRTNMFNLSRYLFPHPSKCSKNKQPIAALLAAITLTLAMSGCAAHSKDEQYILIATNVNLSYWQNAQAGFAAAAKQYGVSADMEGPAIFDAQAEVQDFRDAVKKKPAGILVSVANSSLMQPEIDAAHAAGIPVITIDSDSPESKRLYFIGTNNLAAGRLGGQRVAAQLGGKGNVVFFTISGQPNLDERLKGYKDALANSPGIKVVDVFDTKGDSGAALDKTTEYLARTGANKVDAFICLEADAPHDVGESFHRNHATGRLLIGMDDALETLKMVKDGTIDSTLAQKPYTMALLGLQGLDHIHHYPLKSLTADVGLDPFAPIPAFIDTGVSLIDNGNVDTLLKRQQ
jgi:ribose transport system substrate-binding protein